MTIVFVMLGDEGGYVAQDEQREVSIEKTLLEGTNEVRDYGRDLREKLLVISSELCPPSVYKGSEGESDKVVYFVVEFVWTGWGEEEGWQGRPG